MSVIIEGMKRAGSLSKIIGEVIGGVVGAKVGVEGVEGEDL
jgi:hypothetical protein